MKLSYAPSAIALGLLAACAGPAPGDFADTPAAHPAPRMAGSAGEAAAAIPAINSVRVRAPAVYPRAVTIAPESANGPASPAGLAAAPAGTNLKLWIYDPRDSAASFHSPGIFIESAAGGGFQFVAANADQSVYLSLAPGRYQFDTVEPPGMAALFLRHRHQLDVAASGAASIAGATPDARGIYAVSLDLARVAASDDAQRLQDALTALANEPASSFHPTSPCQLMDQVTPARSFATDVSAGFPKVRTRLPSYGRLRALIVPVDFADVAGTAKPPVLFAPLASETRDFYWKQSYGRLAFDFEILPSWVRLPFSVDRYGFGATVNSGDFDGYRTALIALTERQIDYNDYDAVYFLVPPEMPFARMGWGPAITSPIRTGSGYVINGATGGADMYLNETRGIVGAGWKWMAHETGHAFGLYDEDLEHRAPSLGYWSVMAMSWTNHAIEHNAWDRYLQGWLRASQVACLSKDSLDAAGTRVRLSPLVRQDGDVKAAMVPLDDATILVMESRRNEGYDNIAPQHEGLLVYTVDMRVGQLGGGYKTRRRAGSVDPNFEDAALRPGDTLDVDGVRVQVIGGGSDGDTIWIGRR